MALERALALVGMGTLAATVGCWTRVEPAVVRPAVETGARNGLHARISEVGTSIPASQPRRKLAVGVELYNDSPEPVGVVLDEALVRLGHPGEPETVPLVAAGEGAMPTKFSEGTTLPGFTMAPGEVKRVWLAFGSVRADDEIPRRVTLELFPNRPDGQRGTAVLWDPAGEAPPWQAPMLRFAPTLSLMQYWRHTSHPGDEGVSVLLGNGYQHVLGPIVLAEAFGIGFHYRDWWVESAPHPWTCCDLVLRARAEVPIWQGEVANVRSFVGMESVISGERGPDSHGAWMGPSFGVTGAFEPLRVRHGPFPLTRPTTPLGMGNVGFGYVHWLGPGMGAGQPGFLLAFELSLL